MFFRREDETLRLPEKFSDSIIYPVSNGYYNVEIGKNIIVNEGWNAVVVVKEKPRDIIPSGAYELSLPNLPNTTRLLRLNEGRIKKRSKDVTLNLPQSFKCDLYYVNTKEVLEFPWKSSYVPIKSKLYGRYKVMLSGTLSLKVANTQKFVSLLLMEHGHIKRGQGEKFLSALINEEIFDSILFGNFLNPRQFLDYGTINEFLMNKLNDNFDRYGLMLYDVNTKDTKFLGKVSEQLWKEDEAKHEFLAEKLDADAILGCSKGGFDAKEQKEENVELSKTHIENVEDYSQNTNREVSTLVKVKKKTKQEFQNEISQTLFNSSRMDVLDDNMTKVKLNKKDDGDRK